MLCARTHESCLLAPAGTGVGDGPRRALRRAALLAAGVVWVGALGVLSAQQLGTWRNDELMLRRSVAEDPRDWRMRDMLAEMLLKTGRQVCPLLPP
jgi:hypothetical protein